MPVVIGVDNEHVKIPEFDDSTLIIETPLVLLVANISTVSSGKPFGSDSTSTDEKLLILLNLVSIFRNLLHSANRINKF